jgi:hypothetical protein
MESGFIWTYFLLGRCGPTKRSLGSSHGGELRTDRADKDLCIPEHDASAPIRHPLFISDPENALEGVAAGAT